MPNGDHIPFIRPPSRLEKLESALSNLIDFNLAIAAMCMERGTFTHEELFRMEGIIKDARHRLGSAFTIEDGMAAVQAAFRIEGQRGKERR